MNKTILHFSDIHFGGRHAPNRADALLEFIRVKKPTVVALSGDLTQRARGREFREARAFLDRIASPVIVVPGNHDVPLWNIFDRFFSPLRKYKKWITPNLSPMYLDDGIAVLGIDTTRSFTVKGGHIERSDLRLVESELSRVPHEHCKVLVGHHPLTPGSSLKNQPPVGGGRRALKFFADRGVEIVLSGHRHHQHIDSAKNIIANDGANLWLIQAGTVASLRGRGPEKQKNSFNWIEIGAKEIVVYGYVYSEGDQLFTATSEEHLPRHPGEKSPQSHKVHKVGE